MDHGALIVTNDEINAAREVCGRWTLRRRCSALLRGTVCFLSHEAARIPF
jgi:hypothetical protein